MVVDHRVQMLPGSRAPAAWLRVGGGLLFALLLVLGPTPARSEPIRASYFYSYMDANHLDALAGAGFNRAVIKCISDSLGARGTTELRRFFERAPGLGVEVVPEWSLQARARLGVLPTTRRYTWGGGTVENDVGCPVDSLFWRSVLRDRAGEVLATFPAVQRLAVDLEIYTGSRHHYDLPCRCPACLDEFASRAAGAPQDLEAFEEERVADILAALLGELAATRPGLEVGFFDLDFDSFVHRAMVRALARIGLPTANYSERTYSLGAAAIPAARGPLDSLGLRAPLVCGLKLKSHTPQNIKGDVNAVLAGAEGYFIFTSYSLWLDPARLTGEYVLSGSQADYWSALRTANRAPRAGIAQPRDGVVLSTGETVHLAGTGTDPRDAPELLDYRWEADLLDHGVLASAVVANGATTSFTAGTSGDGTGLSCAIRLIVTNAIGLRDTAARTFTVIDDSPPGFTSGPVVNPAESTARVQWTTNEPARGVVRFGGSPALGDSVQIPLSTSHAASLSGLSPGNRYYVQVAATDASGNTTLAGADSFTTQLNVVFQPPAFPRTGALDRFNRANGSLGSSWTGELAGLAVRSNALVQTASGTPTPTWKSAVFGPDQEAYVTLSAITSTSPEHGVLLKCQGTSWKSGTIEVRYDARVNKITVATYTSGSGWRTRYTIDQSLVAGDQLGGRALSNRTVEVYRNGVKLGTASVSGWTYAAKGGRIGLRLGNAKASRLDDFGGGNVPGATPTVMPGSNPNLTPGSSSADEARDGYHRGPSHRTSVERIELSPAFPNPSAGGVSFVLALPRATRVKWSIHDFQGRTVWSETREIGAGRTTLAWSGRYEGGEALRAGLFFAHLEAGEQRFARRFVLRR